MINVSLQNFCNRTVAAGRLTAADVRILSRELLPEGITGRDEADMLIALERVVTHAGTAFADMLVAAIVDFSVWGERPTGYVDRDTARWLAASIGNGNGPTATGARIAFEVVREAQSSDEALVAFALAANRRAEAGEDIVALRNAA
ncbi:hypothetical protein [Methylobacterium planeticum]|uniref:Uncharacterized protein n=1 Tax=Methylobacterium planeticum TaxID=2615211 RepID=A0A6N6N000_9HYPH|nr:hypothetical protein [Methylobacterium planeticum]KAB1076274.1 hypothetical protein F6X51_01690 [Methylobacterium planeticum]